MTINREYEQRVKTYGNYCTQDNIWAILDHVDRENRLLDAKGVAILDSLKRLFPNDYWLHFIDEMNNRIKNGEHQDSLQFMKRISVAKPVNKKAPEYVKYDDIYFSLRIRGYLGDDDIVEKNGRLFVERGKGERAVKQFKKDSGLPMDADLDTKEASELLRIWQSDWSTRYLGVRKIWTMRMEPGTDSDELILSLVNAGFCRTKPKLCLIKGRHDHPIISKYILAAGKAGCETLTSPYLRRHYRVPDDLETCYRAFQAYHGLTPDGELDEKGISLLRTYR